MFFLRWQNLTIALTPGRGTYLHQMSQGSLTQRGRDDGSLQPKLSQANQFHPVGSTLETNLGRHPCANAMCLTLRAYCAIHVKLRAATFPIGMRLLLLGLGKPRTMLGVFTGVLKIDRHRDNIVARTQGTKRKCIFALLELLLC